VTGTGGGARLALAGRAVIAIEAGASTSRAVADALVGALHVTVGSVGKSYTVSVLHARELLLSAVRIDGIVGNNSNTGTSQGSARSVKITLGGIDVSDAKLANACY
jgi:hypothetical protein